MYGLFHDRILKINFGLTCHTMCDTNKALTFSIKYTAIAANKICILLVRLIIVAESEHKSIDLHLATNYFRVINGFDKEIVTAELLKKQKLRHFQWILLAKSGISYKSVPLLTSPYRKIKFKTVLVNCY